MNVNFSAELVFKNMDACLVHFYNKRYVNKPNALEYAEDVRGIIRRCLDRMGYDWKEIDDYFMGNKKEYDMI